MNTIHPLFEAAIWHRRGEGTFDPDPILVWERAGKPVVEEDDPSVVVRVHRPLYDRLLSLEPLLANKDARIRQLEEEREAWRRNVVVNSNAEAWKSGVISCSAEMPCQKRIKELEADAATWEPASQRVYEAKVKELEAKLELATRSLAVAENRPREIRCCRLNDKDADEIRNAALEEAAMATKIPPGSLVPVPVLDKKFSMKEIGDLINSILESAGERIRALRKP